MLIKSYAKFVTQTDQFRHKSKPERRRIAIYGLVSEIGSVLAAVKKQRLGEGGTPEVLASRLTQAELAEELGDVMWYCFALAQLEAPQARTDILASQVATLREELKSEDAKASRFRSRIESGRLADFYERAAKFPTLSERTFKHYQEIAALTARTEGEELIEVCMTYLMQAGTQLMRTLISEEERALSDQVRDRNSLDLLGEIAWHLSSVATVYELKLDEVAKFNQDKVNSRRTGETPTPLHDHDFSSTQQFPRQFEVAIVTVGPRRSRMYFDNKQLGDDLTDNNYEPDGYRFHDVLHLANVAHLGWSPVVRGMMRRKRKDPNRPNVDEVEDGARAQIVDEAVVKLIHSEGARIAKILHPDKPAEERPIFPEGVDIPFAFLKLIKRVAQGLEVDRNSYSEWIAAIRDGYRVYGELCREKQGTITVDLVRRKISYRPDVYIDLAASIAGIGSCAIPIGEFDRLQQDFARSSLTQQENDLIDGDDLDQLATHFAAKQAVLQAIGVDMQEPGLLRQLSLTVVEPGKFSVRAEGELQQEMWRRDIVSFKTSVARSQNSVYCTALAACSPSSA